MLEARGLTKRYGGFLALDRVDFHVRRGEILGYLGPNGSGKSTTVNMVVGLLDSTSGSISLDGRTIGDGRRGPTVERLQALYRELVDADVAARVAP